MEADDLARRLASHPRWEWRDGCGWRSPGGGGRVDAMALKHHALWRGAGTLPDLTDPATAGVLLEMLPMRQRPGLGDNDDAVWRHGRGWRVRFDGGLHGGMTLGEAIARALLTVWGDE